MARNAADTVRSACPQGENFSASLLFLARETLVTNWNDCNKDSKNSIIFIFSHHIEVEKFS
jgi:hypothetical protein